MKIYNTLSRRKDELIPITPGEIKMYTCGQTVYNDIHIGNARFYVALDVIRRYLEYKGYKVLFAQNFTDIEDKIIKRSLEEGRCAREIAETYIQHTLEDLDALNVLPATFSPRATEEIPAIIEMIQVLIDKGFAYTHEGSVFFETAKAAGYGKLSRKKINDLEAGARVEVDASKRSPMDFVLWKPDKPGEPKWDSPWGTGRPGWHIECSAMIKKYLGPQIDIHGGGEDLIFPHHENEIAQSESANGVTLANYWIHNGILTMDHKKMSKSKGNFFTLREVAEHFPYDVIRFYLLNNHYRMPMEYGEHLLHASRQSLARIKNCRNRLSHLSESARDAPLSEKEKNLLPEAENFFRQFEAAMEDDFNTADAISSVFELVKFINTSPAEEFSAGFLHELIDLLDKPCGILGVNIAGENQRDADLEALIAERQTARQNKDWAEADRIRDVLLARGVTVEDTPSGSRRVIR